MSLVLSLLRWSLVAILLAGLAVTTGAAVLVGVVAPQLPATASLANIEYSVPLRVYTRDGRLMAEFGEQRREPVTLDQVPEPMVQAFLAAEDERFFTHPGVDWKGLTRAALALVRTGEKGQGGSTITMQVARNFFLSREKTYLRKLNEILLSLRIESELSKQQIFELYLNKIFLGHRAYGIGAAARTYYGKPLDQLELAQVAMIAGLPKAPSAYNPIANPRRATARRNYVIRRMRELGFVTSEAAEVALAAPVTAKVHKTVREVEAPYVAEMVRSLVEGAYGPEAYTLGLNVHTTIDAAQQTFANSALREALGRYDRRHGYRGPEARAGSGGLADPAAALADIGTFGSLRPAIVTGVTANDIALHVKGDGEVSIGTQGWKWARKRIDEDRVERAPKAAFDVVTPGDRVRVEWYDPRSDDSASKKARKGQPYWRLAQVPDVGGALVSLDPRDGGLRALVGGYDFGVSKFNRATQSKRQPGSAFKPFLYSAALERGFTAASVINDAPIVWEDEKLEEAWRPENYSGKFYGPTRLRVALYKSRNLVSIRLIRNVGINFVADYAEKFGFGEGRLPRNLSLSLGSGSASPLELASAYTPFANGGVRPEPYFIDRIENGSGEILHKAAPARLDDSCERPTLLLASDPPVEAAAASAPGASGGALVRTATAAADPAGDSARAQLAREADGRCAGRATSAHNAWLTANMLGDVITRGTATAAKALGRSDLAGKTGTTNDQRDAWFAGFNPDLVTVAWVGFDDYSPLGKGETGGRAALPMWMSYMGEALSGQPERKPAMPATLVRATVDPRSGLLASGGGAVSEVFFKGTLPARAARRVQALSAGGGGGKAKEEDDSLF